MFVIEVEVSPGVWKPVKLSGNNPPYAWNTRTEASIEAQKCYPDDYPHSGVRVSELAEGKPYRNMSDPE